MGELSEIAANIIGDASRSLEVSSQNLVNSSTPGYKRRIEFKRLLTDARLNSGENVSIENATDFSQGKIVTTGNPLDLALTSGGFLVARAQSGELLYLRGGRFQRDADGRLVTAGGLVLQADGGDLVLKEGGFKVAADGVVSQADQPVGRLDVVDFTDPQALTRDPSGAYAAAGAGAGAAPVEAPRVQQGAVEASNVTTGAEMVALMQALRRAESGQRVMNVYDDLMGRVLSSFGQP